MESEGEHDFFNGLLRRIRGDRTQQEFADLMGAGRNTIARYESNERYPDSEFLFKLNLLFGVDPSYLILGREPANMLSQRETELLKHFRAASDEDKVTIERMAELAAKSRRARKSNATKSEKG